MEADVLSESDIVRDTGSEVAVGVVQLASDDAGVISGDRLAQEVADDILADCPSLHVHVLVCIVL